MEHDRALSTTYAEQLRLSSAQASLLVATPILVGALGRIVIGSLTDRFGGRAMFIAISLASIAPVLAVGLAGKSGSYPLLLVFGFFLGIAGTVFAVGISFVNAWYPPARRGFATGVFGMGMVGTALSAFFTPRFLRWFVCSIPTSSSPSCWRSPPRRVCWSCATRRTSHRTPARCYRS